MDFNIPQKTDETEAEYCNRLISYYCNQIGTISAYEEERELDRFRKIHFQSKEVLENRYHVKQILSMITELQAEIENYKSKFPELSKKSNVLNKLDDLASLL
jgi:predicted RNase H-like nuclease (RuvC/YqgF family)